MLQATSLAFIVTATMVGVEIDALTPATAAAFVAAGLVSALAFPAVATSALASQRPGEVRPGPLPTPEPNAAGRSVAGG